MGAPNHGAAGATTARRHPGAVTLRVLAALLDYPDAQLRGHLPEMTALIAEDNMLSASRCGEI